MQALEALRLAVERSGLTHRQLATRLRKGHAYVSNVLSRPNVSADLLARVAMAANYRLELVPTMGGESIVVGWIGDESDPSDELARARALMSEALAILERMGDQVDG